MTANTISLAVTAALGACWGSFLNSAYHSTLAGMSPITPLSHGPNCKTSVKPWFNVPVLGWLLRRGDAPIPKAGQLQKTGGGVSGGQLLRGLLLPHT